MMADKGTSWDKLDLEVKRKLLIQALKNAYKKDHINTFPIPFMKKKKCCVNDVYVDGGLEFQKKTSAGDKRRKSELLVSYKDLFRDNCFKAPNCMIKGEPGYGKSTLFHKCVYDWCHENEDSPLQNFQLLIFLRLRQLSGVRRISYAIKRFLLPSETPFRTDDISRIIKTSSPLLVILDGYDEYPDQNLETGYEMETIIHGSSEGTCLPQQARIFLSSRYKPKRYDTTHATIVRLTGFDYATRLKYMQKSTSRDFDTSEEIHNKLTVNPVLDQICRIPLFFSMFAHMTYAEDDFEKWTSLTQFFRYIIKCFHGHLRDKEENKNVQADARTYDIEHSALNELAFTGVTEQKFAWEKSEIVETLGETFYNHYIKIGILCEDSVMAGKKYPVKGERDESTFTTEVYFLHNVICEWYAAIYLSEIISKWKSAKVSKLLVKLNPCHVHYMYRFACGMDPTVATTLVSYVQNFSKELVIFCILETRDSEKDVRKSLREFFETTLEIKDNGSLKACKIELVQLASNHKIPIHSLHLHVREYHLKADKIKLGKDEFLGHLPTVTELQVIGTDIMKLAEFLHLMEYASNCKGIEQLVIKGFLVPMYIPVESIQELLRKKKISVRWNIRTLKFHHMLNLQTGMWENGITKKTLNEIEYESTTHFIQNH